MSTDIHKLQQAIDALPPAMADEFLRRYIFTFFTEGGKPNPTREKFDILYRKLRSEGVQNPQAYIADNALQMERLVADPAALDKIARNTAEFFKNPAVTQAVYLVSQSLGYPVGILQQMWLSQLDTDANHLDPRLSEDEVRYVKVFILPLKYAVEKGYVAAAPGVNNNY